MDYIQRMSTAKKKKKKKKHSALCMAKLLQVLHSFTAGKLHNRDRDQGHEKDHDWPQPGISRCNRVDHICICSEHRWQQPQVPLSLNKDKNRLVDITSESLRKQKP